jgi:hypothetical protein
VNRKASEMKRLFVMTAAVLIHTDGIQRALGPDAGPLMEPVIIGTRQFVESEEPGPLHPDSVSGLAWMCSNVTFASMSQWTEW